MEDRYMKVFLRNYTSEPEKTAARSGFTSTSRNHITDFPNQENESQLKDMLKYCIDHSYTNILEHPCYTFDIERVSRALTHQLVRHRLASYSQQSQRYVDMEGFPFTVPAEIRENPEDKKIVDDYLSETMGLYKYLNEKYKSEDSRAVLPNATHSDITMTSNLRHFLENVIPLRTCNKAQEEIRDLSAMILTGIKSVTNDLGGITTEKAGPNCMRGVCKEDKDDDCAYRAHKRMRLVDKMSKIISPDLKEADYGEILRYEIPEEFRYGDELLIKKL